MNKLKYGKDYGEGVCRTLTYWIGLIQDTNNDGVSLNSTGAERLKQDLVIIRTYIEDLIADADRVKNDQDILDGILSSISQRTVSVDELPDKPPFKEAEKAIYKVEGGGEWLWYDGKWEQIGE